MVRIKQRYLLLNILYPDRSDKPSSTFASTSAIPPYLKYHGPTDSSITPNGFLNILKGQIANLFGDHGMGVSIASLKIVYFSQATSTIILRVPRSHYRLTWAALTFINELSSRRGHSGSSKRCVIRVVRVSGTIRKAEEELLRRSRREIVRAKLADAGGGALDTVDRLVGATVSASGDPHRQDATEAVKDENIVDSDVDSSESD